MAFPATAAALHRVAEQVIAPARKPDNEIALTATPGGFGTPPFDHDGAEQQVRVDGADLLRSRDGEEQRTPLTSLEAARGLVADLVPAALDDVPLDVDPEAAARLADWYAFGAEILEALGATPTLWPEHFDIAIELGSEAAGQRANFGASPGDAEHDEPYLYVGPWNPAAASGELWNATGFRGAELRYSELLEAEDQRRAALEFMRERYRALQNP